MTIQLSNLGMSYDEADLIFKPIDLTVQNNHILRATGANGCGKSSLLKLIAGLSSPTIGSYEKPTKLFYLGHKNGIKPNLTLIENLHLAACVVNGHFIPQKKVETIINHSPLAHVAHKPAYTLSAGLARKLALLRLRTGYAPLWVLDEPMASLDAQGKDWIHQLIEKHCEQGGIAVVASHEKNDSPPEMSSELTLTITKIPSAKSKVDPGTCSLDVGGGSNTQSFSQTCRFFWTLCRYEFLNQIRNGNSCLLSLIFFSLIIFIFPITLGINNQLIHNLAGSIFWIGALFAMMFSLDKLFSEDYEDGWLDVFISSRTPLWFYIVPKILIHWLLYALPLILLTPLYALFFKLNNFETLMVMTSLILGTPILSLIGAMGSGLLIKMTSQSFLFPILMVPFFLPLLIFGPASINAALTQQAYNVPLALQGALLFFTLAITPWLTYLGLKADY